MSRKSKFNLSNNGDKYQIIYYDHDTKIKAILDLNPSKTRTIELLSKLIELKLINNPIGNSLVVMYSKNNSGK